MDEIQAAGSEQARCSLQCLEVLEEKAGVRETLLLSHLPGKGHIFGMVIDADDLDGGSGLRQVEAPASNTAGYIQRSASTPSAKLLTS